MILVSMTLALLTAVPAPVANRPPLRDAITAAAQQSAPMLQLQRRPSRQRGQPYSMSPRAGRAVAGVQIGAAAGFFATTAIGFAASRESGPGPALMIGGTVTGAVLGGFLLSGR